jgi:hypothetical protein
MIKMNIDSLVDTILEEPEPTIMFVAPDGRIKNIKLAGRRPKDVLENLGVNEGQKWDVVALKVEGTVVDPDTHEEVDTITIAMAVSRQDAVVKAPQVGDVEFDETGDNLILDAIRSFLGEQPNPKKRV